MLHDLSFQHSHPLERLVRDMPLEQRQMRAERVVNVMHERNRRMEYFRGDLFSDPAWDILLEIYASELTQQRIIVSDVGMASKVPSSTANRWLKVLETDGIVVRKKDPLDSRRMFVELTPKGTHAMASYFRAGSG